MKIVPPFPQHTVLDARMTEKQPKAARVWYSIRRYETCIETVLILLMIGFGGVHLWTEHRDQATLSTQTAHVKNR